ncbi:ROK family protein [Microbacteriaceae bacterium VKM Ac-2854]|nr:ROK family protein [Microbacteriaceae bacterium VKM Ac-2854]
MSRADLARASGLTRPTVSAIVAELVTDALVTDLGPREDPRIGKPAVLVDIDADAYRIAAVDLSGTDVFTGALVNLRGAVTERVERRIDGATGERAIGLLFELLDELGSRVPTRLLGIGIGTPGIVDNDGVVRLSPGRGWTNAPLGARLRERYGVPVHVGNDANDAALGVHTFRENSGRSLLVLTIEGGIGAGLIIGGSLIQGEQFSAGEIGHVTVDADGARCRCGRTGCLETWVGAIALRARLAAADAPSRDAVLTDAGRALGIALAPVVSVLNLQEIVLTGSAELLDGPLTASAAATLAERVLPKVDERVTVRATTGDHDLVLLGAAAHVLGVELGVS